jgi:hypothetical protein
MSWFCFPYLLISIQRQFSHMPVVRGPGVSFSLYSISPGALGRAAIKFNVYRKIAGLLLGDQRQAGRPYLATRGAVPGKKSTRGRLWLADGSCIRLRPQHRDHVWSYDTLSRTAPTMDGRSLSEGADACQMSKFNGSPSRDTVGVT